MKLNSIYSYIITIVIILITGTSFAQDVNYLEDDGTSLWEEEGFIDSIGDLDEQYNTNDGQYVSEEEIQAQEEAIKNAQGSGLDIASALEKDKQLLPDNIMYGMGTGAVIGGWFALWAGKGGRENVQYLSVGILAGVLLGITVGTKSFYQEQVAINYPQNEFSSQSKSTLTQPLSTTSYSLLNFEVPF